MQDLLIRSRLMLVLLSHLVMIVASIALAFALRFDFVIPGDQFPLMWQGILIAVPLKVSTFHLMGLSRGWWRFIGILDLMRLFWANVMVSVVFTATTIAFLRGG